MPFHPKFTISIPIASALTAIERTRGFLDATQFSEERNITKILLIKEDRFTIQEYESLFPKVSRRTLQRNISDLIEIR